MPNLSQLLMSKSKAGHIRVFNACSEIQSQLDEVNEVFVCGGFVRDLIQGNPPGDIDLCVAGNAKKFSVALSKKLDVQNPAESQFLTFKINTNELMEDVLSIDVVTCRDETYSEPASLPDVVPSSIEKDLMRRDFTINTMAISLSDQRWGELVDPSNGFGDIMRKRIKVLHELSFIDDPTRLFRAVRYATRLGFNIDYRTNQLFTNALGNVDLLSGARVRNEFEVNSKRIRIA